MMQEKYVPISGVLLLGGCMADTWMIGVIYIVFKSDIGQGIFIHHSSYSGNLPMIEDDIYIFEWWVTEHLEYRLYNSCSYQPCIHEGHFE